MILFDGGNILIIFWFAVHSEQSASAFVAYRIKWITFDQHIIADFFKQLKLVKVMDKIICST